MFERTITLAAGLVASPPMRDLLLCAKHLFVAAKIVWQAHKLLISGDSVPL